MCPDSLGTFEISYLAMLSPLADLVNLPFACKGEAPRLPGRTQLAFYSSCDV